MIRKCLNWFSGRIFEDLSNGMLHAETSLIGILCIRNDIKNNNNNNSKQNKQKNKSNQLPTSWLYEIVALWPAHCVDNVIQQYNTTELYI